MREAELRVANKRYKMGDLVSIKVSGQKAMILEVRPDSLYRKLNKEIKDRFGRWTDTRNENELPPYKIRTEDLEIHWVYEFELKPLSYML